MGDEEAKKKYGIIPRGASYAILKFNKFVIDTLSSFVAIVKPQLAYYEVLGASGMDAFWETVKYARSKGLLTIADVKRGDIASTAEAYAEAFFGGTKNHNWLDKGQIVDSITISPYLGRDSTFPFLSGDSMEGKGIFILVKTSNPSAIDLQDLKIDDGKLVSDHMADFVNKLGSPYIGELGYTSVGAVVGASYPEDLKRYRSHMPKSIFLVPGYGAQGGTANDIVHAFNDDGYGALINASRSILYPKATDCYSNICFPINKSHYYHL